MTTFINFKTILTMTTSVINADKRWLPYSYVFSSNIVIRDVERLEGRREATVCAEGLGQAIYSLRTEAGP